MGREVGEEEGEMEGKGGAVSHMFISGTWQVCKMGGELTWLDVYLTMK